MRWKGRRGSENVEDRRSAKGPVIAGGGLLGFIIVVGIMLLGGDMGTHDTGQTVAVGDGNGGQTENLGLGDQFLRVRGTVQEGEIGGDLKFGVWRHG